MSLYLKGLPGVEFLPEKKWPSAFLVRLSPALTVARKVFFYPRNIAIFHLVHGGAVDSSKELTKPTVAHKNDQRAT